MKHPAISEKEVLDPLSSALAGMILVRGIHLEITPALRAAALSKCGRLLRHHHRLVRIRVDLEHDRTQGVDVQFVAKGRVELSGPDLIARVASEDAYKSIDQLADKLDRMVRERSRARVDRRNDRPDGTEFRDQLSAAEATDPVAELAR
jgi:putative sigma-54 modulation protein